MKMKKEKFFKERVLVTGGAGFIGSNFLNHFVRRHKKTLFINVDILNYAGNLNNIEVSGLPNYAFFRFDIVNKKMMEEIFKKYKPTGLINFAAESHVDLSIKNPKRFLETNIIGTNNLLDLSVKYGLDRFLQISTDEVYGALGLNDESFQEDDPIRPRNPYSASKAAAEHLALAYFNTYGLNVVISRSSNNYGPNQDRSKVVPLFIDRLMKNNKIPLYGRGLQIRDWLYVEDNVRAIDLVFRKGIKGEVYNIGGGYEITNLELAKKILAKFEMGKEMINYIADRPGHDFRYSLSNAKIAQLGWKPEVPFDEGLLRTINYFKKNVVV